VTASQTSTPMVPIFEPRTGGADFTNPENIAFSRCDI
jgi:hypothetical protein